MGGFPAGAGRAGLGAQRLGVLARAARDLLRGAGALAGAGLIAWYDVFSPGTPRLPAVVRVGVAGPGWGPWPSELSRRGRGYSIGGARPAARHRSGNRPRGPCAFTVDSTRGDTRWRVIAVARPDHAVLWAVLAASPDDEGGSVIVATSLARVDSTVDTMWRIYESAGLVLLVLLAVAGWFAVRSSLRPLSCI